MKVLYIVGGEGNRYGSEIVAIDLISAGKKNGIDYVVVTANKGAVSEACDQSGIENYVVPFRFFVYKAMSNPILNFVKKTVWAARAEYLTKRAAAIIGKKLDMKSIDLIHTNLSRDLLGGILAVQNGIGAMDVRTRRQVYRYIKDCRKRMDRKRTAWRKS